MFLPPQERHAVGLLLPPPLQNHHDDLEENGLQNDRPDKAKLFLAIGQMEMPLHISHERLHDGCLLGVAGICEGETLVGPLLNHDGNAVAYFLAADQPLPHGHLCPHFLSELFVFFAGRHVTWSPIHRMDHPLSFGCVGSFQLGVRQPIYGLPTTAGGFRETPFSRTSARLLRSSSLPAARGQPRWRSDATSGRECRPSFRTAPKPFGP